MKVRCNNCERLMEEEEIKIVNGKNEEIETCPDCNVSGCLMDMDENTEKVFASFNRFEIEILKKDAESASHSGDCEEDVIELMEKPYIKIQLDKIDPVTLKTELKEYGAWDTKELSDHEENKKRILWIACGDIVEEKGE